MARYVQECSGEAEARSNGSTRCIWSNIGNCEDQATHLSTYLIHCTFFDKFFFFLGQVQCRPHPFPSPKILTLILLLIVLNITTASYSVHCLITTAPTSIIHQDGSFLSTLLYGRMTSVLWQPIYFLAYIMHSIITIIHN